MSGDGHGETLLQGQPSAGGLQKGANLNDTYEIQGLLFEGGMGDIYEARHLRLTGRYAVKVLRPELTARNPSVFDRFRREAEVTSSLRHPHIVQVVDFNRTPGGAAYFVMELLEGKNLRQHLEDHGPLSLADVTIIVEQVASALEAAHERGIVHRDLKPENIQLVPVPGRKEPFVKVLDFGISKVLSASTLTQESMLVGTPFYMAPEQARGGSDDLDGRTDEFALGAIAHELLTGQRIFYAESVAAIIYRVLHDEPESLAPLAGEAVDAAVRRALAKKRDDRFPRVTDFAEAMRDAVFGPARSSLGNVPVPTLGMDRTSSVKVKAPTPEGTSGPTATAPGTTTQQTARPASGSRKLLGVATGIAVGIAAALGVGRALMKSTPEPVWTVADAGASATGIRLAMQVRRLVEEETNHLAETAGRAGQVPSLAAALTARVDEATLQDLLANEVWWADFRGFGTAVLVDDDVKVTWRLPATMGAPLALVKALAAIPDPVPRAGLVPGAARSVLAAVANIEGVKGGRVLLVRPLNRAFLTELATRANAVLLLSDGHKILEVSVPENTLPELGLLIGQEINPVQIDKRHQRLAAVMPWSPGLWLWAVSGWTP